MPNVFQTTPPQPASRARITLYFLSVGGALASQNGLGDLMPRKEDVMSAILLIILNVYLPTRRQVLNVELIIHYWFLDVLTILVRMFMLFDLLEMLCVIVLDNFAFSVFI